MKTKQLTDCHIHLFIKETSHSLNEEVIVQKGIFQKISYNYISSYHGLPMNDPDFNLKYVEYLNNEIGQSKYVKKGIVFGMDGVYDNNGNLDKDRTQLYFPNELVKKYITGKNNLKLGVSVNPARKDALDEIRRALDNKAALNKVLPNSQGFDPGDKKFIKFYRFLAENKMPLLTHCGYEFAIKAIDQSYGRPDRLRLALDEGVTVIAAHGASSGLVFLELYKKDILELVKSYPNFYMDISALTILTRMRIVSFLQNNPEIKKRLLFGTDFPLPIHLYPFYIKLGLVKIREIKKVKNYFDRYATLMDALGLLNKKAVLKL